MSWASRTKTLLALAGRAALAFGLENLNGCAFLGGACWLYVGIAGFSRHLADIVVGTIVMALGAYPYLWRTARQWKKKN